MPQQTDMRMHHGQGPKLPLGWGACRGALGAWGGGLLATVGVDPSQVCTKFERISYELVRIHAHEHNAGLPALAIFGFGHHLAVMGPFGTGLSPDHADSNWACVLPLHPYLKCNRKYSVLMKNPQNSGKFMRI